MNAAEIAAIAVPSVLLLIGIGVFLFSFLKGREEYAELVEDLDEKEFRLKSFLPAGMFLDDTISFTEHFPSGVRKIWYKYKNRVIFQINELYGAKERDFYLSVHQANKWIISLLVLIFMAVFALILASGGDYTEAFVLSAAAPIALIVMPFVMDKELEGKLEERRERITLEFPEFVNKLILLVNAGSTIPKAWQKIVSESKGNSPLYRELRLCVAEISTGKPEEIAYEEFARRCGVKEVIKFVSVVILNLRKGGSEIVPVLRAQADECWETRKATARRLGEKASSKLLGPMAIMLLGVITIVALPAILALTGM